MKLSRPEQLTPDHDCLHFSCGKEALDRWIRTRALSNQRKGFTVVMVIHDVGRVVGYYGLAPTAIHPDTAPRSIRTGQPPNPIPALLLGQLATDREYAGRGIGRTLVAHALQRCLRAANLVGGRAVVVDAIDGDAATFWRRYGFTPSLDDPHRLFRSIPDIASSLSAAGC